MKNETLGERIKEKRKNKKITQKQLAKILNKSESSIQKYESDEVEIPHSVVEEIAKVLHTTVPYLLGYESVQNQMDELKLFNEQLEQLGCYVEEFACSKENNSEVTGCTFTDGTEINCSDCHIKQSCYLITYNNTTVKVPIHDFENLREYFKSYMKFMLLELIKKHQ